MMKLLLFVSRKEGTSREAFRAHYEETHAPLAASLMTKCRRYVRNFVNEEVTGPMGFDCVTEFWFDLDGPWEQAAAAMADPQTNATLEADEALFMDRGSMRILTVYEHETPADQLVGNRVQE